MSVEKKGDDIIIREIKKQPWIFTNPRNNDTSDQNRDVVFNKIASIVNAELGTKKTGDMIGKRWKSIRDVFTRVNKNKIPTGSKLTLGEQYAYHNIKYILGEIKEPLLTEEHFSRKTTIEMPSSSKMVTSIENEISVPEETLDDVISSKNVETDGTIYETDIQEIFNNEFTGLINENRAVVDSKKKKNDKNPEDKVENILEEIKSINCFLDNSLADSDTASNTNFNKERASIISESLKLLCKKKQLICLAKFTKISRELKKNKKL